MCSERGWRTCRISSPPSGRPSTDRSPQALRSDLATDVPRLRAELEAARDASTLPDRVDPAAVDALHDLVVRTRLG